jgi:2-dehydro-3-deoxyglucarate aldolase/4-hydroxy-2-oxoheptanedioate aldolase
MTGFRQRLRERAPLVGFLLTLPSPELAELCADEGFDWLFLDMEHGLLDCAATQRMLQAAGGRCPCLVRVPASDPLWIGKVLDLGADGLILPHIDTPQQASTAVRAAKYPPRGERGIGPGRGQGYGVRLADALVTANENTILVAQAEHVNAAACLGDILDVPGIDAILVGPFDLSGSMGKPGRVHDEDVQGAIRGIISACAARAMPTGILVLGAAGARKAIAQGISLVCAGVDTLLMSAGARDLISSIKKGETE